MQGQMGPTRGRLLWGWDRRLAEGYVEASVPGRNEMPRLFGKSFRCCLERGSSRRGSSLVAEQFWAHVCSSRLARGSGSGWIWQAEKFQIPDLPACLPWLW